MNVLLLCVRSARSSANTLRDHIEALRTKSRHRVFLLQNYLALYGPFGGDVSTLPGSFPLEDFDALVVHYSNYLALAEHFDQDSRERIGAFAGLKVAFIQDEYRTVDATTASLRDLGFDVLFTCVPEAEVEKVYPRDFLPRLRKVSTLTGFVPEKLASMRVPPGHGRDIDVGYRARIVPFWLGELGAEKWQIASRFVARTAGSGLRADISYEERDRIYGAQWIDFLLRCRTVLGVESGASVFDFSGEIQRQVDAFVASCPGATFEEVQARFLRGHEHRIRLNQISPRAFEAAALRTGMVLYDGEYSGILAPGRHYIALRKDFSNIDSVVEQIRDRDRVAEMTRCAYEEIALNPEYSYARFVRRFDDVLEEEAAARGTCARGRAQVPAAAGRPMSRSVRFAMDVRMRLWPLRRFLTRRGLILFVLLPTWHRLPEPIRRMLRPLARRLIRLESLS